MPTYLLTLALIVFKVGCCVDYSMRRLKAALTIKHLPNLVAFAAAINLPYQVPRICFDTNSFVISADTYVLVTMGNCLDQFEDLKLHNGEDNTEVEGMKGGFLETKGTGTFKLHIDNNDGGVHLIKIPNSKSVPELKICFLLPHHWVQEAQDKYPLPKGTKMEEDDEVLTLIWKERKHRRTIPYHPLTNTPSFRTAPALRTYCAFVALCKPAEAQYYCREHVLQMPGQLHLDEEFTVEKNLHANIQKKTPSASEGATSNDVRVQASNLLSEKESKMEMQMTRIGPLAFDLNP
jgi:hypothetical protein